MFTSTTLYYSSIVCKSKQHDENNPSLTAQTLNEHYASVSHDRAYTEPSVKSTCLPSSCNYSIYSPFSVFQALDKLKPTAPGVDQIPWWFLKLCAPFLAEPLSMFFNSFLYLGYYPDAWKCSIITTIPKIANPTLPAHHRPISLTPILSRQMEKMFNRNVIYPLIFAPDNIDFFQKQFAFKPTGSTTAALINLLHSVTSLLTQYPYVHVISLDFSKAFDTLRHSSVLESFSKLGTCDESYSWLRNFLANRSHVTRYGSEVSTPTTINASVIQGSAMGPVCFIINMTGLKPLFNLNELSEYADDCYLIVPSVTSSTIPKELEHIQNWAGNCNLKLNPGKCKELIISRPKLNSDIIPKPLDGLERVTTLNALGITLDQKLNFSTHVDKIISRGHQKMYALKVLKNHGLTDKHLFNVTKALLISTLTYASQAWWGFLLAHDLNRLEGLIRKTKKWGLLNFDHPDFQDMAIKSDHKLFNQANSSITHCLHHLLPPHKPHSHSLRPRNHILALPSGIKTIQKQTFIFRMLFKDTY